MDKSMRLSYSAIKNFTSPINLIDYKIKPFTKNAGMRFGSVCDVLITEPHNFNKQFKILDKIPESENQLKMAKILIEKMKHQGFLEDEDKEAAFNASYKRGDWEKTYLLIEDYVEALALGKELTTKEEVAEATIIVDNLLANPMIAKVMSQVTGKQVKMEWKEGDWDFIGYLDLLVKGDNIIDLKFSKDSNPDKFQRDIQNLKYYLQGGIYCRGAQLSGLCDNPTYSFIVYDKSMNFSVIKLDYSYVAYGIREYLWLLEQLDRCVEEHGFEKSYEFFQKTYTSYKPKWAKGFELKSDN